jgi:hypothetical protein
VTPKRKGNIGRQAVYQVDVSITYRRGKRVIMGYFVGWVGVRVDCRTHRSDSPSLLVVVIIIMAPPTSMIPMLVFNRAAISVPVTHKVHVSFVMRWNPAGSDVWRVTPIAFMPTVMLLFDIPVTVYPDVLGTGSFPHDTNDAWPGRRAYSDSNGHLGAKRGSAGQQ